MAHMREVCQLTAPELDLAWRGYDVAFRQARERSPAPHSWGDTVALFP